MSLVIDIVIIAIILLCTVSGYRKGLIGLAFSIVSFLAAILIAFVLFVPVSNFVIDNTEFDDNIKTAIIENFTSEEETKNEEGSTDIINNYIDKQITDIKNNSVELVAGQLSINAIKVLSFIGLFILAKIVLFFFKAIANLIAELPILKQFNKAGGFLVGILKGLLIVYVILALMLLLSPMFGNNAIYKEIPNSFIGNLMYSNNILVKFLF